MAESSVSRPEEPVPVPRVVLCPYCGEVSKDPARCDSCRGHFDPLSRQATQNSMGPWFVRDTVNPFRPGCSFEVLKGLAKRGKVGLNTVLRGPTTNQFWSPARRVPGLANLLGVCHNCGWTVGTDDEVCLSCGATFGFHTDRQHLGLTEVRLLPGHADPEAIADAASPERKPVAAAAIRAPAPRAVAPRPMAAEPSPARPTTKARAERAPSGGVPRWVWVVAGLAVAGAGFAAAWIMDKVPGMPSPILSTAPGGGEDASRKSAIGVPEANARPTSPQGPEATPSEATVRNSDGQETGSPAAAEPAAIAPDRDRVAEARRLLSQGTEESLRQAQSAAGSDPEGAAILTAAERLMAQRPLRRLP